MALFEASMETPIPTPVTPAAIASQVYGDSPCGLSAITVIPVAMSTNPIHRPAIAGTAQQRHGQTGDGDHPDARAVSSVPASGVGIP